MPGTKYLHCTRCKKKFIPSLFLQKKYTFFSHNKIERILCENCIQKQNNINELLFQHKKLNLHPIQLQPLKLNQLFQMKNKEMSIK